MDETINDTPLGEYLKAHIRKHYGLPLWSLALGIEGVMEEMGWTPPQAKTGNQKEVWECNVCGLPCKIEIQFQNIKLPAHLHKEEHFRDKQFCLCRENRQNWKKI